MKVKPKFQVASDLLDGWRDDVFSGKPPVTYPLGDGLENVEVGPKLVTLIGGAPGAGKTAFIMGAVINALDAMPDLRVCVCNVEMPPEVLLDRQLARLSGISLNTIRYRRLKEEHSERIETSLNAMELLLERLCFVRPPFSLENVAATADAFGATLLVLDYIQRISPPGTHGDKRGSVDATMSYLRQFADLGMAVVVVAAVSRGKDTKGRSSYESLSLASFRESSELEFGADSAFILAADAKDKSSVVLKHLKARNTSLQDLQFHFDGSLQRFTLIEGETPKDVE